MRIRAIRLDDDELPSVVTLDMTVTEALYIATVFGKHNGIDAEAHLPGGAALNSEVYDALTGGVFNKFWDDGVGGARRDHFKRPADGGPHGDG